ncbi:MAG: cation:proton antiporter [Rhizobiales bacterium]|nr:cation:proton antiporter [Hyphomicrobiales bacterium]
MMENVYLNTATLIAQVLLVSSFILLTIRLIKGPTLSDRILCLDMLVTVGIGFIAIFAIRTQQFAYIDVAIALGLTGFLATIAFARYVMWNGQNQLKIDKKDDKNT